MNLCSFNLSYSWYQSKTFQPSTINMTSCLSYIETCQYIEKIEKIDKPCQACLSYIETYSLSTHFVGSFYHKWIWVLSNAIFAFNDIIIIFILHFASVAYHVDWFADIEPFLHSWNKSYLIMVFDSFSVLLNSVCWYFAAGVCIYVHQEHWPVISYILRI